MKIPFDKIFEHVKMNENFIHYLTDEERNKEYHKSMEEQFELMKELAWEDFENLTAEELERIPIAWLYDWTNVMGHWDYQDKVKELYEKHNITILTPKEYIKKYDKKQTATYKKSIQEEKLQKINDLVVQEKILISTLQRLFYISFHKAIFIIETLVEDRIIEKQDKGFKIIDKERLKEILIKNLLNK